MRTTPIFCCKEEKSESVSRNRMKKDESGFSLTEVTVVIGLVLLFSALSIPMLSSSFTAWQGRSDAQNISTMLQSAKFRAISRANRYQVVFSVANNTWTVQREEPRGSNTYVDEGSTNSLSSGLYKAVQLKASSSGSPSGFPTASSTQIRFNSRGIPIDTTGALTPNLAVYLAGGDTTYAVTVSTIGKVKLWSSQNGSAW